MAAFMNSTAASIRTRRGSGSTPASAGIGNGSTLSQYGNVRKVAAAPSRLCRCVVPVREPPNLALMLETAEKLGSGLDFVRVDLYDIGSRIYFGEMTFTPGGGFAHFEPAAMDQHLGELWNRRRRAGTSGEKPGSQINSGNAPDLSPAK